ncbi:MAG: hypothetical protein K6E83_03505 [Clostridium sp.]|nr:hypothetical protein [Clostridium sp.]
MKADLSVIHTAEQDLRECAALDHGIIERLLAGLPISIDMYIYHFVPVHYHIFSIMAADCRHPEDLFRVGLFSSADESMVFGETETLLPFYREAAAGILEHLFVASVSRILEYLPADAMVEMTYPSGDSEKTLRLPREFIQELPEEKLRRTLRLSRDGTLLIDRREFEEHILLKEMEA